MLAAGSPVKRKKQQYKNSKSPGKTGAICIAAVAIQGWTSGQQPFERQNMPKNSTTSVALTLNQFHANGKSTCSENTVMLTTERIQDIIDHATQAILTRRNNGKIAAILDELDEALTVAGVIPEQD